MISQCLLRSEESIQSEEGIQNVEGIQSGDKYILVDEILSATDYYEALGLSDDSTFDEIRRAYIKKSRICHPDKFVPGYPKATKSFQLLSTAYNTLIEPATKLKYDISMKSTNALTHLSTDDSLNAVDIFEQVIRQLYVEILEGEFQTLRTVINVMNETNKLVHINDEVLAIAEIGFLKIRDIILSSQKYYRIIQFELLRLYELQEEIRNLSYFHVWRRIKLSVTIAKVVIQIPLTINQVIKQESGVYASEGLLGLQTECGLQKAVNLFESTELYTASWCQSP